MSTVIASRTVLIQQVGELVYYVSEIYTMAILHVINETDMYS